MQKPSIQQHTNTQNHPSNQQTQTHAASTKHPASIQIYLIQPQTRQITNHHHINQKARRQSQTKSTTQKSNKTNPKSQSTAKQVI